MPREEQSKKQKRIWKNPKYRDKTIKAIMKAANVKPNKPETFLIALFKKHGLPYKYVGDGGLIIDGKCPDFVNVNGQKKIIEHFGKWWHKGKPNIRFHRTEQGTKEHYKKFGFKTLVVWENELKNPDVLLEKINAFDGGD